MEHHQVQQGGMEATGLEEVVEGSNMATTGWSSQRNEKPRAEKKHTFIWVVEWREEERESQVERESERGVGEV